MLFAHSMGAFVYHRCGSVLLEQAKAFLRVLLYNFELFRETLVRTLDVELDVSICYKRFVLVAADVRFGDDWRSCSGSLDVFHRYLFVIVEEWGQSGRFNWFFCQSLATRESSGHVG